MGKYGAVCMVGLFVAAMVLSAVAVNALSERPFILDGEPVTRTMPVGNLII